MHSGLLDVHLPNAVALDELLPRDETIMITVDLVPQEGREARESLLVHDHLPVDIFVRKQVLVVFLNVKDDFKGMMM